MEPRPLPTLLATLLALATPACTGSSSKDTADSTPVSPDGTDTDTDTTPAGHTGEHTGVGPCLSGAYLPELRVVPTLLSAPEAAVGAVAIDDVLARLPVDVARRIARTEA